MFVKNPEAEQLWGAGVLIFAGVSAMKTPATFIVVLHAVTVSAAMMSLDLFRTFPVTCLRLDYFLSCTQLVAHFPSDRNIFRPHPLIKIWLQNIFVCYFHA